jgi:hypothetical protein
LPLLTRGSFMGNGFISGATAIKRDTRASAAAAAVKLARQETPSLPDGGNCAPQESYCLDPLVDSRWDALVAAHPFASVFHSTKWLKTLREVYGYEPLVVTTSAPGSPLLNGLVVCRIRSLLTGNRLVSLPFSDHCEPLFTGSDEFETVLQSLKQKVDAREWKYFELRPFSYEPGSRSGLSQTVSYYFHSLNLSPSPQMLFRSFHKDCVQRKIRRAERERLEYEVGTSDSLIDKFYRLLVMTRRRHRVPPQPISWFRGLVAAFGNDLQIRVASKNGIAVAAILTLTHKKSVVYKYGCSDLGYSRLGGTALLFWRTILESREQGFETLELGRSDTGNAGLVAFKERWGAAERRISYWTYPRAHSPEITGWATKLTQAMVPFLPSGVLREVGNLFYRHVG